MARWIVALFAALAPVVLPAQPVEHVVMISVDGLMPRSYTHPDELELKIPNLRALLKEGVHAEGVIGVLPTVTYPSHTTLITGVPPAVHGVESNTILDPLGQSNSAWQWYAAAIRVPTLISAAKARQLETATVSWPVSVGIDSTYNVPEFWRSGSTHESDRMLLALLSTPRGILDHAGAHRGRPIAANSSWTDQERIDIARFVIETYRPALTLIHIFDTDSAQHDHGPGSAEALRAIEKADERIGEIRRSLERSGIASRTALVIVSDHGFLPVATVLKPNTLLRDAGLVKVENGKVVDWTAWFHADGGSSALILRDPADEVLLARVRALVQKQSRQGLRGALTATEARGFGSTAPLVLNAAEGFHFSNSVEGSWSAPSTTKGTHGFAPDRPELHASLIIAGPFPQRGSLGVVPMTRIASTIAWMLDLELSSKADQPLDLRLQTRTEPPSPR